MSEEHVVMVESIPVIVQECRYFVRSEVSFVTLWVCDVVRVGDSTVFCCFLVVGCKQQMSLIPVPHIRSVEREIEVGCALVLIIAASIQIVELEAHTNLLVYVDGKQGFHPVFTVVFVSTRIVC